MALANCGVKFNKQENGKWHFDLIHPTLPIRRLAADTEQDYISWKHTLEWVISLHDEAHQTMKEGYVVEEGYSFTSLTYAVQTYRATITQGPRGKGLGLEVYTLFRAKMCPLEIALLVKCP